MRSVGRIRILVVLADGFAGWTRGEDWGSDALRLENEAEVIKAAFVGNENWKDLVFAFVGHPIRQVPIECFASEPAARAWLLA